MERAQNKLTKDILKREALCTTYLQPSNRKGSCSYDSLAVAQLNKEGATESMQGEPQILVCPEQIVYKNKGSNLAPKVAFVRRHLDDLKDTFRSSFQNLT